MSTVPVYLLLSTQTAPKTSLHAQGGITYAILKDEASSEVYFTLLANTGGSGYFGREIIPFSQIAACLAGADLSKSIPAKRFLKAFALSRSVNNGGFLCACLRHQALLKPAPESPQQHVMGDDWDSWKATMLQTASDQVFVVQELEKPAKAVLEPGKKDKKSGGKSKKDAEGEQHADPA